MVKPSIVCPVLVCRSLHAFFWLHSHSCACLTLLHPCMRWHSRTLAKARVGLRKLLEGAVPLTSLQGEISLSMVEFVCCEDHDTDIRTLHALSELHQHSRAQ